MFKYGILLVLGVFFLMGLSAQNEKSQFTLIGVDETDFGTCIQETPSGDIINSLSLPANPPSNSLIATGLVRMDCAGKIKSEKIFKLNGASLISRKLILRDDKPVLLGSLSVGLNEQRTHVLELDENGSILSQYSYLSSATEIPKDIIAWPNGGYLVLSCGDYNINYETTQLFLVNSSFNISQSLRFSLNQREMEPEAMALTPDGGVLIIGDVSSNTTFRRGFAMKLGPGGVPQWTKTFASEFDVEFTDLVFEENGEITISGWVFRTNTGFDGLIVKLNNTGDILSSEAFHLSEDDRFRTFSKNGTEYLVAGDAGGFDNRSMIWIRLNNALQIKDSYRLTYGAPFTNYAYHASSMKSGSWLLTGEFTAPNVKRDGGFIRTDSLTGSNCNGEAVAFESIPIELTTENVTAIRTEPERIVEETNLIAEEASFNETTLCTSVPPVAKFGYTVIPDCPKVCVQFTDSSYCSVNQWSWEFPNAEIEFSVEQNPRVCYPGDGVYTAKLIASNEGGADTLEITLNLSTGCDLPVPNAFSPNGDGKNDFLVIPGFPPGGELFIYNRWGAEVFQSQDYQNNWDGGGLTPGTYYYLILTKEGNKYTGYITLII